MNVNELKEIVKVIEKAKIDTLSLEKGNFKLNYTKNGMSGVEVNKDTETIQSLGGNEINLVTDQSIENSNKLKKNEKNYQIKSPMIGAFYSRPNPDAEPFVQVGSEIKEGDNVCVLEAMKLLNEVKSDINGKITEILVNDGDIIEFGQALFTVEVNGPYD